MGIRALKYLSLFIIFINLFYGAFAILQLLMIKNVVFMSIYIKFFLLIVIYVWIIYLLLYKKVILLIHKKVAIPYIIWIIYSLISLLLLLRFNYPSNYILFSYISTMFYPAFMLFFAIGSKKISISTEQKENIYKLFTKFLYICAIIIWPLGIAQYLSNNQIITFDTQDNYWTFMSQNFIGQHIRATSFFSSGLDFGIFSILILAISLSRFLFHKKNIVDILFILMSIFCIYISLTRNAYIVALFTVITIIFMNLNKIKNEHIYAFLPILYLIIIVLLLIYISPLLYMFKNGYLLNSNSILMRFKEWSDYYEYIVNGNIIDILFGSGLIQNGRFDLTKNIIVDNIYLSLVMYEGLIGLFCYLFFYFSSYIYLVKRILIDRNYFEIAIISIISSYLVRGFFNITVFGDYMNFILLFLILIINKNRNLGTDTEKQFSS